MINSHNMDLLQLKSAEKLKLDISKEYPYAEKPLDPRHPTPSGEELHITFLCDLDHTHDKATRRFATDMWVLLVQHSFLIK